MLCPQDLPQYFQVSVEKVTLVKIAPTGLLRIAH